MVLEYLSACAIENWMNSDSEHLSIADSVNTVLMIIALLISIATAYLAYVCNKKSNIIVRLIVTILGFLFSGMYLIYYLLVHVLFGDQCSGTKLNFLKNGRSFFKGRKKIKRKKHKKKR